jgi:K+-transporting ATPase KdpF subunit
MFAGDVHRGTSDLSPEPTPIGIELAAGSVAVVTVAAGLAGTLPAGAIGLRCAGLAALVGVTGFLATRTAAAVGTAALAWLIFDGFLLGHYGELTWPGTAPATVQVAAFAAAAGAGALLHHVATNRKGSSHVRPAPRPADGGPLRRPGAARARGRATVNAENLVGLVLAVVLGAYVLVALLFPDRF